MSPGVLIVDDSLTVRMDLQDAFKLAGIAATACETVAAARAHLAREPFSLVILDVLLPDGDGLDLLCEIKGTPATAAIPVMLLSTEAEVRDRVRGLHIGADDYVGKPYDSAGVLARARQLMRATGQPPLPPASRLLLIDDSATFRAAFREELEDAGYTVVTAENGEDGLRTAVLVRPNLIVVDGILPGGMDGRTVVRRLKQDLALRDVPCLLLTASEVPDDELRGLDAGADAYVRKGADFAVVRTRIAALLRSAAPQRTAEPYASSLLGPKKILIVDDSLTFLHKAAEELRKDGYDVIPAPSGREALQLLEAQQVDCILLDLLMPGLSGQETCQIIKNAPAWRNIPLLILTAVEETQAMIEGINAGADDYIAKSSDFEVLKARVRAQLRRKQFEEEYRSIREKLLEKDIEAAEARASQKIAEAKAILVDQLEAKNRELEAFSYSVSHDLRAPLRSMSGFAQLLAEELGDGVPAAALHYLNAIRGAATHMNELIDAILQLSRLERTALSRETVDLSSLARSVAADLRRTGPERRADFVVEDALVTAADPHLVRVVLENLLGNAWKFTGKVPLARIEVGALSRDEPVVYFVRDNGAGFPMKYAAKLFGVFQRLHRAEDFEGTGIGLASVQRIVHKHRGRVWAEGEVGHGAIFYFTLDASAPVSGGLPKQVCHEELRQD